MKAISADNGFILKDTIVFDVGANRGQYIKFLGSFLKNKTVYSFEPNPIVYKKLAKFQKSRIKTYNYALGNQVGQIDFYAYPFDLTSSLILPNVNSKHYKFKRLILGSKNSVYDIISVQIDSINNFVEANRINQIDILKIDVEGSELEVLKGASNLIALNKVKIIQVEIHFDDLRASTEKEIATYMFKYGYSLFSRVKHPLGNFGDLIYTQSK
jgi:FkbM family methyltransferase